MPHGLHLVLVPDDDLRTIPRVENDGLEALRVHVVSVVVMREAVDVALEARVRLDASDAGIAVPWHAFDSPNINHGLDHVALVGLRADSFMMSLLCCVAEVDSPATPACMASAEAFPQDLRTDRGRRHMVEAPNTPSLIQLRRNRLHFTVIAGIEELFALTLRASQLKRVHGALTLGPLLALVILQQTGFVRVRQEGEKEGKHFSHGRSGQWTCATG